MRVLTTSEGKGHTKESQMREIKGRQKRDGPIDPKDQKIEKWIRISTRERDQAINKMLTDGGEGTVGDTAANGTSEGEAGVEVSAGGGNSLGLSLGGHGWM
jgi:hypothetical protein